MFCGRNSEFGWIRRSSEPLLRSLRSNAHISMVAVEVLSSGAEIFALVCCSRSLDKCYVEFG